MEDASGLFRIHDHLEPTATFVWGSDELMMGQFCSPSRPRGRWALVRYSPPEAAAATKKRGRLLRPQLEAVRQVLLQWWVWGLSDYWYSVLEADGMILRMALNPYFLSSSSKEVWLKVSFLSSSAPASLSLGRWSEAGKGNRCVTSAKSFVSKGRFEAVFSSNGLFSPLLGVSCGSDKCIRRYASRRRPRASPASVVVCGGLSEAVDAVA